MGIINTTKSKTMFITIELNLENEKRPMECSGKGFWQFFWEYGIRWNFTMPFVNGTVKGWRIKKIIWK